MLDNRHILDIVTVSNLLHVDMFLYCVGLLNLDVLHDRDILDVINVQNFGNFNRSLHDLCLRDLNTLNNRSVLNPMDLRYFDMLLHGVNLWDFDVLHYRHILY